MAFSMQELTDMVLIYGECKCNMLHTCRVYAERFPQRRVPNCKTILHTVQRLRDTGSVVATCEGRGRERPRRILQAEAEILQAMEDNPTNSARGIAAEVGVSYRTVRRILRDNLLHPYHVQQVQQLHENDFQPRIAFSRWFQDKLAAEPDFLTRVLFMDECCFTRQEILKFHNTHYRSNANPHVTQKKHFQQHFSLNVWCGVLGDRLVGPIVLPTRLDGLAYLNFLEDTLPDLLEDIPLAERTRMFLLYDGASPHVRGVVRDYLKRQFPRRWIGHFGPVRFPPHSSDMNPLDFCVWEHMKQRVYSMEVQDAEDLQQRIFVTAEQFCNIPDIFSRIRRNAIRRFEACILAGGAHFEQFL